MEHCSETLSNFAEELWIVRGDFSLAPTLFLNISLGASHMPYVFLKCFKKALHIDEEVDIGGLITAIPETTHFSLALH